MTDMAEMKNDLLRNNEECRMRMERRAPMLCQWFDNELTALHAQMPQKNGGLLMGCPVWGQAYIARMARYSLPTLGTERNLAALGGKCWMVFYTTTADRPLLWKATRWLRQAGIHTIWRCLPDELVSAISHPEDKYGLLATAQNVLAHMAGHAGMGLHMYMPDHLYSDGYFDGLAKLGYKFPAILQQSVSVAETAVPDIEGHRAENGAIAIPARALGGIALEHMHARSRMHVMNWGGSIPDKMPDSRQVMWIGKDALHIADCCQLLSWLAPELCLDAPIAFTSTLDMLAPEYVPPGMWTMPTPEDEMVYCELSDAQRLGPTRHVSMDRWLVRAWSQVAFTEDYAEYLQRRCLVPIPDQAGYLADDEIERQHGQILDIMHDGKARAMANYFSAMHPSRWS